MFYNFPHILNIEDVLPAIEGAEEFRVIEKGPYTAINYMVSTAETFPEVNSKHDALRRECRGIIFCSKTGKILRRPYHKFFNLNQVAETQMNVVDFSTPHAVIHKYDGSMIAPFYIAPKKLHFGTKLGETEASEKADAFAHCRENYVNFSKMLIARDYTPIFEWCSPHQRIVLRYDEDMLVLTAIRHMHTGEYTSLPTMKFLASGYKIPTLEPLMTVDNPEDFTKMVAGLKNLEGYVVRFNNGHMVKVKAEEYCEIHSAKEHIVREKNVLQMIFEERLDDVVPHLQPEDANRINTFSDAVIENVKKFAAHLKNTVLCSNHLGKKDFAFHILDETFPLKKYSGLLFKIYDGHDPLEIVRKYLLTHCGTSNKVETIRDIIGVTWIYGAIDA